MTNMVPVNIADGFCWNNQNYYYAWDVVGNGQFISKPDQQFIQNPTTLYKFGNNDIIKIKLNIPNRTLLFYKNDKKVFGFTDINVS